MKRSVLRSLAALGLALPALALAGAASADDPPLSSGCASLHAEEDQTFTVSNGELSVSLPFSAGEQVRFTPTTAGAPSLTVTGPNGQETRGGSSGAPLRYDVTTEGSYTFRLTTSAPPMSVTLACGIPPEPLLPIPDGTVYYVNYRPSISWACVAHTNPVASCPGGPYAQPPMFPGVELNTTHAGDFTFTVTATDTSGLSTAKTWHYRVVKRPQTITMAEPPEHVLWGHPVYVTARSDSGLIVNLSVDPSSTGCGDLFQSWSESHVFTPRPGTCVVHADQPGNDEYEAAEQVTRSFVVHKRPSRLEAPQVTKGFLNLFPTTFTAYLRVLDVSGPGDISRLYPGQQLAFTVGGKTRCTGTTDANGTATCAAKIGFTNTLRATEYTVTWAGTDLFEGTSATGVLE